ncbi:MAG: hypothetical protein FWD36_03025 [Treponema sp.]|nr:hypothetical protein [Treponema sp.]
MKKSIIGLTAAVLLSMTGNLWAQNVPSGILESPQSAATQGRYRSTADNFIRTDTYGDVRFNTFFAYTSFAASNRAALGFATKAGDTYLAAYYGGNFWTGVQPWNYTEHNHFFNGKNTNFQTYDALPAYTNDNTTTDNRVAILFGITDADAKPHMGLRFSYASTHQSFKAKDDIAVMTTPANPGDPGALPDPIPPTSAVYAYYKNYRTDFGYISPQVEWAMAKDLTEKKGVRPKVGLTLNFVRDYTSREQYDAADGTTIGEQISKSNNFFLPHLVINPGGYHVYNENGFRATVDLDYELSLRMYNNEYSYLDSGKWKTDKIKGLNNSGAYSEDSWVRNLIIPSIAGQWSGDAFAFRFKLNLPVELTNIEKTPFVYNAATRKLEQTGDYTKTGAFMLDPNLRLAMQWRAVPSKLTINAGARLNFANLTLSTTEGETFAAGKSVAHTSFKRTNNNFGRAGANAATAGTSGDRTTGNNLTLGTTFMPSSNLTFEANCGIGTNNNVNVFSDTGIFSFGSVLVSLRF